MNIHAVLVVWGKEFIDTYFRAALPSHLARGNLPDLSQVASITYHFFTPEEDRHLIESHPLFHQLRLYAEIAFHPFRPKSANSIHTQNDCHREFLRITDGKDPLLFLSPDGVFSINSFMYVWKQIQKKKRVVLVGSPRTIKDAFLSALEEMPLADRYSPRNMVQKAMMHLHPVSQSLLWDRDEISMWPSHLYWPLDKSGLVLRCFHLHPLLIWPEKKVTLASSFDDYFVQKAVPNRALWVIVQDSDEFVGFEVSKPSHLMPLAMMESRIENVANWLQCCSEPFQRDLARYPIVLRSNDADFTQVINRSQEIISRSIRRASYPPLFKWPRGIYRFFRRKWKILKRKE